MSLDFDLINSCCDIEVYASNITHNLGSMASEVGIYNCLWRAPENGYEFASQMIDPLENGLKQLESDPEYYKTFNPDNGWGDYDGFILWLKDLLKACIKNPEAKIYTSR